LRMVQTHRWFRTQPELNEFRALNSKLKVTSIDIRARHAAILASGQYPTNILDKVLEFKPTEASQLTHKRWGDALTFTWVGIEGFVTSDMPIQIAPLFVMQSVSEGVGDNNNNNNNNNNEESKSKFFSALVAGWNYTDIEAIIPSGSLCEIRAVDVSRYMGEEALGTTIIDWQSGSVTLTFPRRDDPRLQGFPQWYEIRQVGSMNPNSRMLYIPALHPEPNVYFDHICSNFDPVHEMSDTNTDICRPSGSSSGCNDHCYCDDNSPSTLTFWANYTKSPLNQCPLPTDPCGTEITCENNSVSYRDPKTNSCKCQCQAPSLYSTCQSERSQQSPTLRAQYPHISIQPSFFDQNFVDQYYDTSYATLTLYQWDLLVFNFSSFQHFYEAGYTDAEYLGFESDIFDSYVDLDSVSDNPYCYWVQSSPYSPDGTLPVDSFQRVSYNASPFIEMGKVVHAVANPFYKTSRNLFSHSPLILACYTPLYPHSPRVLNPAGGHKVGFYAFSPHFRYIHQYQLHQVGVLRQKALDFEGQDPDHWFNIHDNGFEVYFKIKFPAMPQVGDKIDFSVWLDSRFAFPTATCEFTTHYPTRIKDSFYSEEDKVVKFNVFVENVQIQEGEQQNEFRFETRFPHYKFRQEQTNIGGELICINHFAVNSSPTTSQSEIKDLLSGFYIDFSFKEARDNLNSFGLSTSISSIQYADQESNNKLNPFGITKIDPRKKMVLQFGLMLPRPTDPRDSIRLRIEDPVTGELVYLDHLTEDLRATFDPSTVFEFKSDPVTNVFPAVLEYLQGSNIFESHPVVLISHTLPIELTRYCFVEPEKHIFHYYSSPPIDLCLGGNECLETGCTCSQNDPDDLCGGATCSINPTTCSNNYGLFFPKKCECQCGDKVCASGFYLDDECGCVQCATDIVCQNGGHFKSNMCQCECPDFYDPETMCELCLTESTETTIVSSPSSLAILHVNICENNGVMNTQCTTCVSAAGTYFEGLFTDSCGLVCANSAQPDVGCTKCDCLNNELGLLCDGCTVDGIVVPASIEQGGLVATFTINNYPTTDPFSEDYMSVNVYDAATTEEWSLDYTPFTIHDNGSSQLTFDTSATPLTAGVEYTVKFVYNYMMCSYTTTFTLQCPVACDNGGTQLGDCSCDCPAEFTGDFCTEPSELDYCSVSIDTPSVLESNGLQATFRIQDYPIQKLSFNIESMLVQISDGTTMSDYLPITITDALNYIIKVDTSSFPLVPNVQYTMSYEYGGDGGCTHQESFKLNTSCLLQCKNGSTADPQCSQCMCSSGFIGQLCDNCVVFNILGQSEIFSGASSMTFTIQGFPNTVAFIAQNVNIYMTLPTDTRYNFASLDFNPLTHVVTAHFTGPNPFVANTQYTINLSYAAGCTHQQNHLDTHIWNNQSLADYYFYIVTHIQL
jgi:hypothetical protein